MRILVALVSVLLVTVACGGEPAPERRGATGGTAGYPFTIDNCGVQVTFDKPPQRAASLYQSSTEILLALGLGDRMVGTSTWFDPVLPQLKAENDKVPRLADNDPSLETVLDTEPDLVTSASSHTFTPAVVAERSRFAQLGIPTYQSPSICVGAQSDGDTVTRSEPLQMDRLFREIRELARIFDVRERGDELIHRLQNRLAAQPPAPEGRHPTVAFWFAETRTPYLAGCCSAPGLYARTVGATNIIADAREDWPEIGWETVADRDPDILVLGDLTRRRYDGDALAAKKQLLESNPVTRKLTAVREKHYVVLSGSELDPGIRQVDAIEKLAAGIAKFGPFR